MSAGPLPPRLASWLLRRALPRDERAASIAGDLLEEFRRDAAAGAPGRAAARYCASALSIAARYTWRRRGGRRRADDGRAVATGIGDDVRYALRSLVKAPSFAVVAVLTLAVGVGANTAIFSVLHAVVLRDLPYHEPDRLVLLHTLLLQRNLIDGSSHPDFRDWKEQSRELEDMEVYRRPETTRATIGGGDEPERVHLAMVGPRFFRLLGAPALLGRTLEPADVEAGSRVGVISHSLWRQRFAGDTAIVGREIDVDGRTTVIVGVMAADFELPTPGVQMWLPISMLPNWPGLQNVRDADMLMVIGRLRAGATIASARAELETVAARLRAVHPATNADRGVLIEPLADYVIGSRTARPLWQLFGAVGCVLLIACLNVANLGLARASARRAELSLRTALGASRWRLVRQTLIENLVLSVLAAAVGLTFAWIVSSGLTTWASAAVPRLDTLRLDAIVLLFGLIVSLLCGQAAAVFPALQLSLMNPFRALRDGGSGSLGGTRLRRVRHGLVVAEVALAVVLVTGAGLLLRSFVRLQAADRGFDSRNLLLLHLDLPAKYNDRARRLGYFTDLFDRIRAQPGVAAAGAVRGFFIESKPEGVVSIEGRPRTGPGGSAVPLTQDLLVPGFFEAMGIPVLRGRGLRDSDLAEGAPLVVVINETMARQFWPGQDPIGKRLKSGADPAAAVPWMTVVGVVGDMRRQTLDRPPIASLFRAGASPHMDVAVRTIEDATAMRASILAAFRAVDPGAPPYDVATAEQRIGDSVAIRTLQTLLLGALAIAALVLAVIGVYGVVHQSVVSRTQEIGVRMALGASQPAVLWMILSRALSLAGAGLGVGVAAALALGKTIAAFLYETSPADPLIFASVAVAFVTITAVACLAPARRAARVDPMIALRSE